MQSAINNQVDFEAWCVWRQITLAARLQHFRSTSVRPDSNYFVPTTLLLSFETLLLVPSVTKVKDRNPRQCTDGLRELCEANHEDGTTAESRCEEADSCSCRKWPEALQA